MVCLVRADLLDRVYVYERAKYPFAIILARYTCPAAFSVADKVQVSRCRPFYGRCMVDDAYINAFNFFKHNAIVGPWIIAYQVERLARSVRIWHSHPSRMK